MLVTVFYYCYVTVAMDLVVISGMLGAGKTSVLLKLIDSIVKKGYKTAVIENEIGSMGVDGDVINGKGVEIRELEGGCMCCTMKTGLIETLVFLKDKVNPEVVLVEPTGVANPGDVLETVNELKHLNIGKVTIFIVIDAERFMKAMKVFERLLKKQVAVANVVLINKMDAVSAETADEIESVIRAYPYEGPVLRIQADDGVNMDGLEERAGL